MENSEVKIGLPVIYYSVITEKGEKFYPQKTVIRSESWPLGNGEIGCKVEGIAGWVSLKHLDAIVPDAKDATLTLNLKSKSGFDGTAIYKVSSEQWVAIIQICEGKKETSININTELLEALEELLTLYRAQWGHNETTNKAHNAIAKALRNGGTND